MFEPMRKSNTFNPVIPSTLFEAAAIQRPILLCLDGQAEEIFEAYGAGICFEPEDNLDFNGKV
jgi:hypothetical protein